MMVTCIEYNLCGQGRLIVVYDNELATCNGNVFLKQKNTAFEAFVNLKSVPYKQTHVLQHILLLDGSQDAMGRPICVVKKVDEKNVSCTEADVQDLFMFFAEFDERYGFSPR